MSTEENKRNVLRWREEIWNRRNLDVIDELAAPDYVGHMAGIPEPVRGPEALRKLFATYLAGLDTHVTTDFVIAEGEMVAVRDTNWVKHVRDFQGIPPTGKEVTLTSTDLYRMLDGRIVEQWFEADLTGMLHRLGVAPNAGHGAAAPVDEHKALVRRFSEEILTDKRLDLADRLVAPDYVDHAALPGQAPGLDGAKQKWAMWMAAVPDLRTTVEELVAEGDAVAARWTAEGTHRGELLGIPPSGRHFRFGGMSVFHVRDGRIVEQREEWDRLALLQQLGAVPRFPSSSDSPPA